jgi:DHA1 family purine base/nucleoside efflux pump-like MFS transporter
MYTVAAAILLLGSLEWTAGLVAARVLQGAASGLAVPASMALVPSLVPAARRGMAIATVGSAHNLTMVALPPVSLEVLKNFGMGGVSVLVCVLVLAALAIVVARPVEPIAATTSHLAAARRRFGFAWRGSWFMPLAVIVLFVLHWGVLIAYLPQRAVAAHADIGLFFAADGAAVLLARIPAGWLADHMRPVGPVLAGVALTFAGVVPLFDPPTTPVLIVAGLLTGIGGALIIQPLMLAMTARSTDADRGSAFSYFSASFSASIALASVGTAPLIGSIGFTALLTVALGALGLSAVVALLDADLRRRPNVEDGSAEAIELAGEANAIGP